MADNRYTPEQYEAALDAIPPEDLEEPEWHKTVCAARSAGIPEEHIAKWSARDPRFDPSRDLKTIRDADPDRPGGAGPGTLVRYARQHGWDGKPAYSAAKPAKASRKAGAEAGCRPGDWKLDLPEDVPPYPEYAITEFGTPADEVAALASALYEPGEQVNIYIGEKSHGKPDPEHGGKCSPKGAGRLYRAADLSDVDFCQKLLSENNPAAGAWFRPNPIDREKFESDEKTKAPGDRHVARYAYAVAEADEGPKEKQLETILKLGLPWAALIDSGNKSIHAIVRIDAGDIDEFHKRFGLIKEICADNGLEIDPACRNPSRLSRLPGAERENGGRQKLIAINPDPESWGAWVERIESMKAKARKASGSTTGSGAISRIIIGLEDAESPLLDAVGWDMMQRDIAVIDSARLPWEHEGGGFLNDVDWAYIAQLVQDAAGNRSDRHIRQAMQIVADRHRFNPALDLIRSVEWDGQPHAELMFEKYLGADGSRYTRSVSRLFFQEILNRVIEPGSQCDYTPVLKSDREGIGKTTFCEALAMDRRYFVSLGSIRDEKAAGENMRGKTICVLEEAQALRGRGITADKANEWLTAKWDTFRPAYGTHAEQFPRTACTIIPCNSMDWMDSIGDARRFLPIECGVHGDHLPLMNRKPGTMKELHADVMQAYAEVLHETKEYRAAHGGDLPPAVLDGGAAKAAKAARESMMDDDGLVDAVMDALTEMAGEGTKRASVSTVLAKLAGFDDFKDMPMDRTTRRKIGQVMDRRAKACGWKSVGKQRIKVGNQDRTQRCWEWTGMIAP